jgi:hypothetical protein
METVIYRGGLCILTPHDTIETSAEPESHFGSEDMVG